MRPEQYQAAMESVMEWGPQRSRSDDERLAERRPEMSPAERLQALQECKKVADRAYDYAGKIKANQMSNAIETLRKEWPWLTEEQAGHAFNQGMYYHWKDTGE